MNQNMLKKLKQMQRDMLQTQQELEEAIFSSTAGGGMVKVDVKGNKQIVKITIDKEAGLEADDLELLEDTLVAALNDVMKQIDEETQERMAPYTAGIPGGLF